jgi:hypothetical protein
MEYTIPSCAAAAPASCSGTPRPPPLAPPARPEELGIEIKSQDYEVFLRVVEGG